jgi:hypothetical protein
MLLFFAGLAIGQEVDAPQDDSRIERLRAELEDSIAWNEYYVQSQDAPLEPRIVMRWGNQVRGEGSAVGLTVLWTDQVRPQVIASIFPWQGILTQEYDALTREPHLEVRQDGQMVWQPKSAGLEFRPVPQAPPPAPTDARRRLQLKELASQFHVTLVGWLADESDREELRMLPQWLYRYGEEGQEVLDGALFAYVVGTDPEAALLLEAFRSDDGTYEWQYAFVRQTSGILEGRWQGEVVWKAERPGEDDPAKTHFRLRRSLPADLR